MVSRLAAGASTRTSGLKASAASAPLDRAQPVRSFRMAGRREVIEAGGMGDIECRHRADLIASAAGRKGVHDFTPAPPRWR